MGDPSKLKKVMTVRDIWCLALGAMIGFGCFVLPGNSFLPDAGPLGTTLGLLIGAAMVMVISASFSYLIQQMPRSGGSSLYASVLFGKGHGFFLGWFLILTYWSLIPLNATALGLIGRNLFPGVLQRGHLYAVAGFDVYLGEIIVALFCLVGVAFVNLLGAKSAGWIQTAITFGLVGSVLLVAVGVLFSRPDFNNLSPAFPKGISAFRAIFSIVAMTPWAFVGFDCIPQAAEEFNFPPKRALRIMISSIAIAALIYVIVNAATAIVRPWEEILREGWATGAAVKDTLGNIGLLFVGIAMTCGVLSGMNAFLLSASRLLYSMSDVGTIPSWFGKVNQRTSIPSNAILFLTVLSLAAPFLGRQVINWIVDMASVGASLSFAYTCAATMKLARQKKKTLWRIIGGAGLILSVFFLCLLLIPWSPGFLSVPALVFLGLWTVIGVLIHHITIRNNYSK